MLPSDIIFKPFVWDENLYHKQGPASSPTNTGLPTIPSWWWKAEAQLWTRWAAQFCEWKEMSILQTGVAPAAKIASDKWLKLTPPCAHHWARVTKAEEIWSQCQVKSSSKSSPGHACFVSSPVSFPTCCSCPFQLSVMPAHCSNVFGIWITICSKD